jgi:hypothetical protein
MCCRKNQAALCYSIVPQKSSFDHECVAYELIMYLPECDCCKFPKVICYYYDKNKDLLGIIKVPPTKATRFMSKIKIIKQVKQPSAADNHHEQAGWCLPYNHYGKVKQCYSNLHNVQLGKLESWDYDLPKREPVCSQHS